MNGASKILTVSYGTFSCTLEGFEDPFNTMKAIAEYFRDLAAEDRYFGAEPPQPDAAMLHRIAEREIQRRVEAKVQENGVILRAEDGAGQAAALPAAAEPQTAPQPSVQMPARGVTPAPRPAPSVSAVAEPGGESVAEKLSRLRKAAAEQGAPATTAAVLTAAATVTPAEAESAEFIEDQHADAPAAAVILADALDEDLAFAAEPMADVLPEEAPPSAEAILAEDLPVEQQSADEDDFAETIDAEDLADMLALDGAAPGDLTDAHVVEQAQADAAPDLADVVSEAAGADAVDSGLQAGPDAAAAEDAEDDDLMLASLALAAAPDTSATPMETQPAPAPAEAEGDSDAQILANLGLLIDPESLSGDDEADLATPQAPELLVEDEASDLIEAEASADAGEVLVAEPAAAQEPEADMPPVSDIAEPFDSAEMAPLAADDVAAAQAQAETEEAPVAPVRPVRPVRPLRPAAVSAPQDGPAAEDGDEPLAADQPRSTDAVAEAESRTPITVDKLQRARARVIKIRRNDAAPPAAAAAAAAEAATTPAVTAPPASGLSPEAEAALAAELRALQEEVPAAPAPKADPAPQDRFGQTTEDQAVNRLMAEASTKMEVPDTKRRMSAIAHLKAAVAATLAERRATGSSLSNGGAEKIGVYRDDLAKAVRAPDPGAAASPADRPAPLVLVSEQRIDRPAGTVSPSRPQRPAPAAAASLVAEPDLDEDLELEDDAVNIFGSDSAFPEFAERLGARDLPDLLEAAAAYIACVEGRDSFTRPQLMRHIDAAAGDVSREDGLRSFGVLLRDGVFERSRRGQFAIHEGSALLAEAKKISRG
ncbi:MAG: hypothetical protein MUC82_07330 [Cypionkella sp.]|nr:hypothetical protein [Cypionkella sp.]